MSLANFDINMFNEAEVLKNDNPEPAIQELTSYEHRKTKRNREENLSCLPVYKYLEFILEELAKRKKTSTINHIDDLLPQKECKTPIKKS